MPKNPPRLRLSRRVPVSPGGSLLAGLGLSATRPGGDWSYAAGTGLRRALHELTASGAPAGIGIAVAQPPGGHPVGDDVPWSPYDRPGTGQWSDAYLTAVNDRLGPSSSPADFCRKAQLVNYEQARAAFEAWRAGRPLGGETLPLWVAHPGAHRRDHGLAAGGAHYGARKGAEPLHVQAAATDGWQVLAANGTAAAVHRATVTARLHDLGGRPIGAPVSRQLDLAPHGTADAFAVPFDRSLPATHLLRLRLTDGAGRVLSANDYLRCRTPTDMRSLNGLPSVPLSLRTRPAGPLAVTATVRNTGTSPAAMVRLALAAAPAADRVRPAVADDNCFWLLPGESRQVTVSWAAGGDEPAARPALVAEAYNALRVREA